MAGGITTSASQVKSIELAGKTHANGDEARGPRLDCGSDWNGDHTLCDIFRILHNNENVLAHVFPKQQLRTYRAIFLMLMGGANRKWCW